jgi:hypothetical protein
MKTRSTIAFLALAVTLCNEELPRKVKMPRETYPSEDVIYDSVTAPTSRMNCRIASTIAGRKGAHYHAKPTHSASAILSRIASARNMIVN